ncbi:hypothetical protein [Alicyclobacillus acidocaldarius]|nr:hypothetical protein [Alicyclobacillus acidocaldarius]
MLVFGDLRLPDLSRKESIEMLSTVDQMVAYCFGRQDILDRAHNHFEQTIDELLSEGEVIWTRDPVAGVIAHNGRWYVWFRHVQDDGRIEGKLFACDDEMRVVSLVVEEIPWLEPDCRMKLLRALRAAHQTA